MMAAYTNRPRIVTMLLQYGASSTLKGARDQTALDYANRYNNLLCSQILRDHADEQTLSHQIVGKKSKSRSKEKNWYQEY